MIKRSVIIMNNIVTNHNDNNNNKQQIKEKLTLKLYLEYKEEI